MNEISLLHKKLNLSYSLLEKPYFYTNGKFTRSSAFDGSKKMYLKDYEGTSIEGIIGDINKNYIGHDELFIQIDNANNGQILKRFDGDKIIIKCLMI